LIIGARQSEPFIEQAQELGIPCVLVGRQTTDSSTAAVGRNEEEITLEAANYLLDLGHRAIAFVGGDEAYSYTHSRLRGYRCALRARDLDAPDQWVALGNGRTAAERILANSAEITAAIFVNDAHAMEGLPVFQAAGRAIPDGLSVISFDDTQDACMFDPPLTSVSYPRFQEGLWSIKVLIDQMRQPLIRSYRVVFRASLVKRESCAPPSGASNLV
jgi:DNA-binding LacI/PurR family transcriptional regulator